MPGNCPTSLRPTAARLWKTFRSKPNAIPVDDKNCSPSPPESRSPSDRNAVRNHNGIVFGFRPESRSPSTGFPTSRLLISLTRARGHCGLALIYVPYNGGLVTKDCRIHDALSEAIAESAGAEKV